MEWTNSIKSEERYFFAPYWNELKQRLIRTGFLAGLFFLGLGCHIDDLWRTVLYPTHLFYPDLAIVTTALTAPFFMTWSLIFQLSLMSAVLWLLLEFCWFIWPGLYKIEKQRIVVLGLFFLFCIVSAQYIAWRYLFPSSLSFFLGFNKSIPMPFLDVKDFLVWMRSVHQIVFFMSLWPALFLIPYFLRYLSFSGLSLFRPYIYVLAFFLGMVATPPDVFLQICVAMPLIIFYEVFLLLLYLFPQF